METVADNANGNGQAVGGDMWAISDSDTSPNCGVIINSDLYSEICVTQILGAAKQQPKFCQILLLVQLEIIQFEI